MTKAMLIDLTKCFGCYNCVVACMDEHVDNDWSPIAAPQQEIPGHFWMNKPVVERGAWPKLKVTQVPTPCMHCASAPCQKAATGGAVYTRSDGIVIIDPVKSVGQKQLVAACPYGAIFWNDALNIPQKCTFCAHLLDNPQLDQGLQTPRCVVACPTNAISFGEDTALNAQILAAGALPMHPELGTQPRVFYKGLPRTFITGSLYDAKTDEVVKGATLNLTDMVTGAVLTATSDNLGDFWFDGLANKKVFELNIAKSGYYSKTLVVATASDRDMGDIGLAKVS